MQVCTALQTDNQTSTPSPLSFLQAGCPSCRPTNSVKALKALRIATVQKVKYTTEHAYEKIRVDTHENVQRRQSTSI